MPASYCFGFSSTINWRCKRTHSSGQGSGSRQMSWPLNSWDGTHIIGQFCGSSHLSLWTCPCKKQFGGWGYAALLGHPSLLCCQHSMGGEQLPEGEYGKVERTHDDCTSALRAEFSTMYKVLGKSKFMFKNL